MTVNVGAREVTCQFLNGPVASANCTIQYGTDPTYVNLPNTDSSTGTNVNSLTVPLSTPLLTNTVYYYVVSSMGVRIQGTFRTGTYMIMNQISKYLVLYFCGINIVAFIHTMACNKCKTVKAHQCSIETVMSTPTIVFGLVQLGYRF